MTPRTVSPLLAGLVLLAAGLTLAARPSAAAWPHDPRVSVPVSVSNAWRCDVTVCSDGAGGMYLASADPRTWPYRIHAQRLRADGTIAPGWPATGVALRTASPTMDERAPSICPDGSGGAFVSWWEYYGTGWTAEGWRYGDGVVLCNADMGQPVVGIVSDGAAGAIITWLDERNGYIYDLYAQRIERFGQLGDPQPSIVKARDVPNDQGGHLRVSWNASYVDAYPGYAVYSYRLWRQVPAKTALAAIAAGARLLGAAPDEGRRFHSRVMAIR